MKNTILHPVVAVLAFILTAGFIAHTAQFAQGEANSTACRNTSTSRVVVGATSSTQVLATTSNRAYARISQPSAATNTVSISFNGGTAATMLNGELLAAASTTPGERFIEFGLSTPFPYDGAVTALTSTGSTTVIVTNCTY